MVLASLHSSRKTVTMLVLLPLLHLLVTRSGPKFKQVATCRWADCCAHMVPHWLSEVTRVLRKCNSLLMCSKLQNWDLNLLRSSEQELFPTVCLYSAHCGLNQFIGTCWYYCNSNHTFPWMVQSCKGALSSPIKFSVNLKSFRHITRVPYHIPGCSPNFEANPEPL